MAALLFALAAAGAETLRPKNIDISLTARWDETPLSVESAEFMADEGLFWDYAAALHEPEGGGSDQEVLAAIEAAAAGLLSPLRLRLLRVLLSAHVFSPRAAMWRQIAATDAATLGVSGTSEVWVRACGRAHALPDGAGADGAADLVAAALSAARADCPQEAELLSVDRVFPGGSRAGGEAPPLLVLYARLGSAAFHPAHDALSRAAADGRVRYALRPLPQAPGGGGGGAQRQTLQGYGVQLAIKNMEYKAMDDKDLGGIDGGDGGDGDGGGDGGGDEEGEEAEEHGFYFRSLAARAPEVADALGALREELAAADASHDASELKVWALQDLGVQAAARVLAAKQPLRALRDLCQNFPFLARGLSKGPAPRELALEVDRLQQTVWGSSFSGAFLNGRPLPLVETNDLAGLLTTMTREMRTVDELQTAGVPPLAIRAMLSLPAAPASLRVSARHPAVVVLNDIGRDRKYARWPPSVKELLRPNPWGQISFCRKNVFTMVFVLDPATGDGQAVLGYLVDLHAQGAPIRFGIVLAPGATRRAAADAAGGADGADGADGAGGGDGGGGGESGAPATAACEARLEGSSTRLSSLAAAYSHEAWAAPGLASLEERAALAAPSAAGAGAAADAAAAAGAAAAAALVGDSEEEAEAERLGLLLTKLFLFCKRRMGSATAMRFLAATRQVRELGGGMMNFFGGPPQLDELQEEHLREAFHAAASASRKEGIDAAAAFEGLSSGASTEFDAEVASGATFLADKGLPAAQPLLLLNGLLTRLGDNFEQEIMQTLSAEVRTVQRLVRTGKLTDEHQDVYATIANATATFPRYNEALLQPIDKVVMAGLKPSAHLGAIKWLATPPAPPSPPSEAAPPVAAPPPAEEDMYAYGGGDEFGDEEDGGGDGGDGGEGGGDLEQLLHPVSKLLVLDLSQPSHVALAAAAVEAAEAAPGGRVRLGLLQLGRGPAGGECTPEHGHACPPMEHLRKEEAAQRSRVGFAAWEKLLQTTHDFGAARRLLALLHAAALAGEALTPELLASAVPEAFSAAETANLIAGVKTVVAPHHAALCRSLGVSAAPAIVVNGRLVDAATAGKLDAVDLALLSEFEYKQRAQAPGATLVRELVGEDAAEEAADAGGAPSAEEFGQRSDLLMLAVAALSRGAQAAAAAGGVREMAFRPESLGCGAACVQLAGSGPGKALELTAVLDPLSKEAQRAVPILMALHESLGLSVTLHLNPSLQIDKFPLESFYRYVVSLEPSFDNAGRSLSPQLDRALFSSLRTPQVLTLHVDAPEAWLLECTEAAYDMDNLRLAELGDRRTVSAVYELASLLITGSCEDVGSRHPPNGLQLLLGTTAQPHATDTLVMSNLGYFQLKAAPGVWDLSLAPGPSSEVFTLRTAPALLAAGHSTRAFRGGMQRIDPATLNDAAAVRVTMADFTGANILLLAQKRPGLESVSILDDDKQGEAAGGAGAGDGGERAAGVIGSVAKWWSGGEKGDASETVHVFSLASGHLYERFLKIMLQSVLQRTKRHVKFWFLKNFLSPAFIGSLPAMAAALGFEYGLVQYQWPSWLHKQTDKQRIIWGYKILFLDVMFPLSVRRIIYIDADQVVNADVGELWDMKLPGRAAVAMTPFCQADANPDTTGFRFFAQGYWRDHLQGRPYHISALFVVDLHKFRRRAYGDQYRVFYDSLSKDPNSLSNLDQDLPNYAQHVVPIHSLPEEWLWCETWCGNTSKPRAKTIDLCNNPLTKEPKLSQATRVIGERWSALDAVAKGIEEAESPAQPSRDEL